MKKYLFLFLIPFICYSQSFSQFDELHVLKVKNGSPLRPTKPLTHIHKTLLDSLVAGWLGGTLADVTGKGNALTATIPMPDITVNWLGTMSSWNIGLAIGYSGNYYLTANNSADLQLGGKDFSIVWWMGNDGNGFYGNIFTKSGNYTSIIDDGTLGLDSVFYFNALSFGDPYNNLFQLTDQNLVVITCTSGGNINLYLNDVLVRTATITPISNSSSQLLIGIDELGDNSQFNLGDCYIYHRIITQADIDKLWNNGNGKSYPFTP